jgi:non-ribosomal peptide synthetase component E (peptide arylation enzyme)
MLARLESLSSLDGKANDLCIGDSIRRVLGNSASNFFDLFPSTTEEVSRPAILSMQVSGSVSKLGYSELRSFLMNGDVMLTDAGVMARERTALIIPNGPLLATCLLMLMSNNRCSIPLNDAGAAEELLSEMINARASTVIIDASIHNSADIQRTLELGYKTHKRSLNVVLLFASKEQACLFALKSSNSKGKGGSGSGKGDKQHTSSRDSISRDSASRASRDSTGRGSTGRNSAGQT